MNAKQLTDHVRREFSDEQAAIFRHEAIADALRSFEGKRITRHMNRALSAIGAVLSERSGMFYASFPAKGSQRGFDHLLAHDSEPVYTRARFEENDSCHGKAAVQRNAERSAWLAGDGAEKAAEALARFEEAAIALAPFVAMGAGPARYAVNAHAKTVVDARLGWCA